MNTLCKHCGAPCDKVFCNKECRDAWTEMNKD